MEPNGCRAMPRAVLPEGTWEQRTDSDICGSLKILLQDKLPTARHALKHPGLHLLYSCAGGNHTATGKSSNVFKNPIKLYCVTILLDPAGLLSVNQFMELFPRNKSYLSNYSEILIPQVMGSVSKAFQKCIKNLLPDYLTNFSNLK